MDIFSHGLWTAVIYHKEKIKLRWWAVLFGVTPDLLSFGILFIQSFVFGVHKFGPPDLNSIPSYVYILYNISHSLIVWLLIFGLVWLIKHRPWWPLAGAIIHILIDIPTHEAKFFPTPFLWPTSNYVVDGYSWGHPLFLLIDYSLLAVVYTVWYLWLRPQKPLADK